MNQTVQDTNIIYLANVRLGFVNIATPQVRNKIKDGQQVAENSYGATFLMSPDSPEFKKFWDIYLKIAADKWKQNAQTIMGMIQSDKKSRCYGDGNTSVNQTSLKPYAGFPGNYYITATKLTVPQLIRADGSICDNQMEATDLARRLYRGCYVNAAIKPWLQDNAHGKGIRCELVAIQFNCDGKPLASNDDVTGMFGAASTPTGGFSPAPGNVPAFSAPAPAMGMPPAPFAPFKP